MPQFCHFYGISAQEFWATKFRDFEPMYDYMAKHLKHLKETSRA